MLKNASNRMLCVMTFVFTDYTKTSL